jgi:hypothetical protein
MFLTREARLRAVEKFVEENKDILHIVMGKCVIKMEEYREHCEKANNNMLVNTLNTATCIIGATRKYDADTITMFGEQCKPFLFADGKGHSPGSQKFYDKYLAKKETPCK